MLAVVLPSLLSSYLGDVQDYKFTAQVPFMLLTIPFIETIRTASVSL